MKIFKGLYKIVIIFILLTMYTYQMCYANDLPGAAARGSGAERERSMIVLVKI